MTAKTRKNFNRMLAYKDGKINCGNKNYEADELCLHNLDSDGERKEPQYLPCFIEEIGTTIDL